MIYPKPIDIDLPCCRVQMISTFGTRRMTYSNNNTVVGDEAPEWCIQSLKCCEQSGRIDQIGCVH